MSTIDYDLTACLEENPQGFSVSDIKSVVAVWEGENDGDDWRWILEMIDGRYIFLQGGCDYTGWDCQSWASHSVADSPEKAAQFAISGEIPIETRSPADAGMMHIVSLMSGTYNDNANEVYESLINQIKNGKNETWHESKADEFGNPPMIDINSHGGSDAKTDDEE